MLKQLYLLLPIFLLLASAASVSAQCTNMEPGFHFTTSSKGCAPYNVNIATDYLNSTFGADPTIYYVTWGDGTPEEQYTQTTASGVILSHRYPSTSTDCGYFVTIDASNSCNPKGSVVQVNTEVTVWTYDQPNIDPQVYRICAGFAGSINFTDNSDWNCFPRLTRENNAPRWVQWIYGTGNPAIQVSGVKINGVTVGSFPYLDPAPGKNPQYPVTGTGQTSLSIDVPTTTAADIGKEFEVTLKNWNQCNPYDANLSDGAFNPVNGDLVNGDSLPKVATARVLIVAAPQPTFITRLGDAAGPIQSTFCLGDNIFFEDQTPAISGANFGYTWEFFDNNAGTGVPATSNAQDPVYAYTTTGPKLIRLHVKDLNAAGSCENTYDGHVVISPSLIAKIKVTDTSNNVITPNFCQQASAPYTTFTVRFNDASVGTTLPTTQWRWEFYDQNNTLISSSPAAGFSSTALGPFDMPYTTKGKYITRLIVRDNVTSCQTIDTATVMIYEKPVPVFQATRVCEGQLTTFTENSTLQAINGESIVLREWDFNYNGTIFNKDAAYDNQTSFTRSLGAANTYQVALRVTTDQSACSDILVIPVTVDPLPNASFTPDVISGCSILTVNFTNTSVTGQPDVVDQFIWEIDEKQGLGFQPVLTQHPGDPDFSNVFTKQFENTTLINKQFDVRLHVITANTCEKISLPVTITVYPGTKAGFISTNYSPFNNNCSPVSVDFSVDAQTQSLNPTDYSWQISDVNGVVSTTSTGTTPTFTYLFNNNTLAIKDYQVKLTTTLATTCYGDSIRTIRISPLPSSQYTIDTLQFDCNVLNIRLIATQQGLASYHWVIKENGVTTLDLTSSDAQVDHSFDRPASAATDIAVQISLDDENLANCPSDVTTKNITVPKKDNINASFTVTPATQSLPNATVTITNTTNPGPWQYLWDFGDNTTSTDPAVTSHTYTTFGNYTITLTVTNTVCVETHSEGITILAIPPVVDFAYDPPNGCVPLTVNFTNLSKYAQPDLYVWQFGNGQATSHAVDPTYTYYDPGTYSITLSATSSTGQTTTITKPLIIDAYPKPHADFIFKPAVVTIPGGVLYTSNQSLDAIGFHWDFGDGETSVELNPQHTYKQEGNYTITLIAANEHGCLDTAQVVNAVLVKKGGQVLFPNAFSPGSNGSSGGVASGDGKNDVFLPITRGVVEFELLVFNRWGQLLFESHSPDKGWDGYYNGKLCEQDVYVYRFTGVYENGEKIVNIGDINLLR